MELSDWLKQRCGLDIQDAGEGGAALAAALYALLVAAGYDYAQQKELLLEAADRRHDLAFGNACLDRIADIQAFERRRAAMQVKKVVKCHSGVAKNKQWGTGAEYAELRFCAARPVDDDTCDLVDDMLRALAAAGYLETRADLLADLRQGLGYYRSSEDPCRPRRTVRWLRGQNLLHAWIAAMLGGRSPLIRVGEGAAGCWVTAASLFVDRQGKAFTYSRLEHGVVRNEEQLRWLRRIIPAPPSQFPAPRNP